MKTLSLFLALLAIPCATHAAKKKGGSNSSGPDSPIVVGRVTAVAANGKSVTILHQGSYLRQIEIGRKTKVSFVGMPKRARQLTVGYDAKASIKKGAAKYLKLTQPLSEAKSLGPDRTKLTVEEILRRSDDDRDGGLSYIEVSRWIHHSPKHGPDQFEKIDKSKDGLLDAAELPQFLSKVIWWNLSRKSPEAWFAQCDQNQDGALDENEFAPINGGEGHIENRFKRADQDRNGKLSMTETTAYISAQLAEQAISSK